MGTRLFIGNLSYNVNEQELREAFTSEGIVVRSVRVSLDRETGRPRGFAFVETETDEGAKASIEKLSGRILQGRPIIVEEAQAKPAGPRPGGFGGAPRPGGFGGPRPGGGPGTPHGQVSSSAAVGTATSATAASRTSARIGAGSGSGGPVIRASRRSSAVTNELSAAAGAAPPTVRRAHASSAGSVHEAATSSARISISAATATCATTIPRTNGAVAPHATKGSTTRS